MYLVVGDVKVRCVVARGSGWYLYWELVGVYLGSRVLHNAREWGRYQVIPHVEM